MATRKLPKGATTKRPSSRGYASNRAVIDSLVAPEKVPVNYPSTMSGSRDSQRQAFKAAKTGISETYKLDAKGNKIPISEEEFKKAAQKFVKAERKIPKGTSLNQVKAARLSKIKQAAVKVQGAEKTLNANDSLSAAERKMAREGNAPARAPATPPTPKPAAPAPVAAPKVATTTAAPKMTRAERSAANKAKHVAVRAAEEKKWAEQKAAKKAGTVKAPAKVKATTAKPAAPAKTVATPAAKKPVAAKPAKVASAPKAAPKVAKPAVVQAPQAATPKQGFLAKNFPNVSTVLKEGLTSKIGRQAAVNAGKNLVTGALTRGNVAVTLLTYSPDAGNKAADDAMAARLKAAVAKGRKDAAGKASDKGNTAGNNVGAPQKVVVAKQGTSGFGAAFKQARQARLSGKAGDTFQYGGKTYTSYQKGEQSKAAAPKAVASEMPKSAARAAWNASKATDMGTIEISKPAQNNQMQQSISAMQLEEQFKKRKGPR